MQVHQAIQISTKEMPEEKLLYLLSYVPVAFGGVVLFSFFISAIQLMVEDVSSSTNGITPQIFAWYYQSITIELFNKFGVVSVTARHKVMPVNLGSPSLDKNVFLQRNEYHP
jgi:hypothetical protein